MSRWIISGLFTVILIWGSTTQFVKTRISPYFPDSSYCEVSKADLLPHLPESANEIWRLSEISMIVNLKASDQIQFGIQPQHVEKLLKEAQNLTHWPQVLTPIEIKSLYKNNVSHLSLLNQIWGVFKLVNLMILVGLVGMLTTFYPCLSAIAGPIVRLMQEYILRVCIQLKPYFKLIIGSLCVFLILWGQNCPSHIGYHITLTGLMTLCASLYHSYSKSRSLNENTDFSILMGLITLLIIPLAVTHDSQLMGYLAVMSFYTMIGFSVMCFGLCWMIGFHNDDALFRAIATGLIIQPFVILLEITLTPQSILLPYLHPFLNPLIVFGHIVYYLALLIFVASSYTNKYYGFSQMLMIGSLLVSLVLGFYFTIPGLVNVAIVYAIIYAVEKSVEFTHESSLFIVIVFAIFAGIYFTALHLSANPQIIQTFVSHTFRLI